MGNPLETRRAFKAPAATSSPEIVSVSGKELLADTSVTLEEDETSIESPELTRHSQGRNSPRNALKTAITLFALTFPQGGMAGTKGSPQELDQNHAKPVIENGIERIEASPEIKELFEKYPTMAELVHRLEGRRDFRLTFRERPHSRVEGAAATEFEAGSHVEDDSAKSYFQGVVEYTPADSLEGEDKESFPSTLYHEITHAEQDYVMWRYVYYANPDNKPKWLIEYYLANPQNRKVQSFTGQELDSYYKQVIFQKTEMGNVLPGTLAGYFSYHMRIQMTNAFHTYEPIRKLVAEQAEEIKKLSGYTLESFLESRKK